MTEKPKSREDENLKRMLKTPPKHHAPMNKKEPKKSIKVGKPNGEK